MHMQEDSRTFYLIHAKRKLYEITVLFDGLEKRFQL